MQNKRTDATPGFIKRMLAATEDNSPERAFAPFIPRSDPSGAGTAREVMKHIAAGAGAATARSGKGGKSGGGLGGQQAAGLKGGAKRKTHAGRK